MLYVKFNQQNDNRSLPGVHRFLNECILKSYNLPSNSWATNTASSDFNKSEKRCININGAYHKSVYNDLNIVPLGSLIHFLKPYM